MNKKPLTLALILFTALTASNVSADLKMNPKEIMQRNDLARRVNEFETRAKLVTGTTGNATTKIKEFTLLRKIQADNVHNSTFTRFHEPAEVRNEGILIIENTNGRNDVLLYLPTYKKVRRVESQQQSGSFMGSVFSYSDIATPHVEDYEYKLIKEEKCPNSDGIIQCSVVECIPANDDIKERTGYSKSVLWVRQDNFMGVHGEYYNLEGELFKKLEATQIKMVDLKSKKWLAHYLSISNLKTHEFTTLEFTNVKVNGGISDSVFTQQNLQKVN